MIKHVVFDVDGVFTDGKFYYSAQGKMMKAFGAHDHDGLNIILDLGLSIDFVSADSSGFAITSRRIRHDWGFDCLHLVPAKVRLEWISSKYDLNEVVYVGDGYYDAEILSKVGLGIAPKNARREAKAAANFITQSNSGDGAVLDACLHIKEVYNGSI